MSADMKWITARKAGEMLGGIGSRRVRQYITEGRLEAIKTGNLWLIAIKDVEKLSGAMRGAGRPVGGSLNRTGNKRTVMTRSGWGSFRRGGAGHFMTKRGDGDFVSRCGQQRAITYSLSDPKVKGSCAICYQAYQAYTDYSKI